MNVSDFQEQHENMHACGRPALQESREVMSLLPCRKLGVVLTDSRGTGGRRRWSPASVTRRRRGEKRVPTGLPPSLETGAEQ